MKKWCYILVMLLPMFSCTGKREAAQVMSQRDSLAVLVAQKDSIIDEVFVSLNSIGENLEAIREREQIITADVDRGEIRKTSTARIGEDVAAIDRLLQDNRQTIDRLKVNARKLEKANVKIGSLEKMITQMSAQMDEKDTQIGALKENLRTMNIELDSLHTAVADLDRNKTHLEGEVKSRNDLLNTAYYLVGSQKELLRSEIVYKSGFIGKTLRINENRNLDNFTQVDIRDFSSVLLGKKNVTLVSTHPADSYEFRMGEGGVFEELVITDPERFWEYSKVLVVSYK